MLNRLFVQSALLFIAVLGFVAPSTADTPDNDAETPVLVELEGLERAEGKVYIAVYTNAEDWLGDAVYTFTEVDIVESLKGQLVSAELLLPPGQYALSVFYDVNGNGELDTNFLGMPKEPVGASNNAKAKYGPHKYEDAEFDVVLEPVIQRIRVKTL